MRDVAASWLVEVDRQALPTFVGTLDGTGAALSPELGEAVRRVDFPRPVAASVVTASGLVRFALAIQWEGSESEFPGRPQRVHALRRHDRFAAARLAARPDPARKVDVAVTCGRLLAGSTAHFLPRRSTVAGSHPSRAGEKIAEALDLLNARGFLPHPGAEWLELGAFPGGMTTELSRRGYRVLALDVAAPTAAMQALPGVTCCTGSAESFVPSGAFDALLCDVNGHPGRVALAVARLADHLVPGGLLVHTLKLPSWDAASRRIDAAKARFAERGLETFLVQHLRQNRQEVTLFAQKERHVDLRDR